MSDVDKELLLNSNSAIAKLSKMKIPPQWIQCDLRTLDMSVLGKFSVIMAGKFSAYMTLFSFYSRIF